MSADRAPIVLLASPDSLFPSLLAEDWLRRGERVVCVHWGGGTSRLPKEVERIDAARERRTLWDWTLRVAEPLALQVQSRAIARNLEQFRAATGKEQPEGWEGTIWIWLANAWRIARTARKLQPKVVFACEAMCYSFAASLCRPATRVVFPYGGDVYNSVETWWGAERYLRRGLQNVDLVVPSATLGANHIVERLGVARERVHAISWGVDLDRWPVLEAREKSALRAKWGLPADAPIVTDCRRFRPVWGSRVVLESMLRVAAQVPEARFLLIGGPGASDEIAWARTQAAQAGVLDRFLLLDREISVDEYRELALLSDVGVSVMPRGDMRSSSVLEFAAAGAELVLGENAEYRGLVPLGFRATFVANDDSAGLAREILSQLASGEVRESARAANRTYVETHENRRIQFQKLWDAITIPPDGNGLSDKKDSLIGQRGNPS